MKKRILLKTNLLICMIVIIGFALTAVLSYRANYSSSIEKIEQVTALSSDGIYYQMNAAFTKPINISLTMANDSLLRSLLEEEPAHLDDVTYPDTIKSYLNAYEQKYGYDSVFLVSAATGRYYNFNGIDRKITPGNPENEWYYTLLDGDEELQMRVDNDEVAGADNQITLFINCKLLGKDGKALGAVGVGLRIDYIQQIMRTYEQEFSVNTALINSAGVIEVSPTHTSYEPVDLFETEQLDEATRKDVLDWTQSDVSHRFWSSKDGSDRKQNYMATRYLPELGWHLVVTRNVDALMSALKLQMVQTVCIIACIIIVILFILTAVIRVFNKKIVGLTQSIEQERHTVFEKATEQLFENVYEIDITRNMPANPGTQAYFESLGAPRGTPYDEALHMVAEKQIKKEFRQGYIDLFSPQNVLRALERGEESLRYECQISKGGAYYWIRITTRIVRMESDGSVRLFVYRQNIDAEKRHEKRMLKLVQTDEMTGLLTKMATQQAVERVMESKPNATYAFFLLDIDDFKRINDQYGHAFGDQVIAEFARLLQKNFRGNDIVGRIGGDEFAAFIPIANEERVEEKVRALVEALDWEYQNEGKSLRVSASIGVALVPRDGVTREEIYVKADQAMYYAKAHGKNSYTIYSKLSQEQREE